MWSIISPYKVLGVIFFPSDANITPKTLYGLIIDHIAQHPNPIDGNIHPIPRRQRKFIPRYKTSPRHQKTSIDKISLLIQPFRQLRQFSLDLADGYFSGINRSVIPVDRHPDHRGKGYGTGRYIKTGTQRR